MIFVTIGNATQGFRRLLDAVDILAGDGFLGYEQVFIQTGHNRDFNPQHCKYRPFLKWMEKATLIICHGGCGTLLHSVRLRKVPVAMPRRKKYGEHVNDHQVQLVQALAAEGRVIPAYEPEDLPNAIAEARRRATQPKPPQPSGMIELVAQAVTELAGEKR
jgi:UDP-N-acetylglucosamine transferase subunit ALG13